MNTEFTCNNGRCVDMKYRCDKIYDCDDHSDEEVCDYFDVDSTTYNKIYPPISRQKGTEVKVHMNILHINRVNELEMNFDAKIGLTLEWFETRLSYRNLLDAESPNIIKEENKEQVWIPTLVFSNTYQDVMLTNEGNAVLRIIKQGNHTVAPLTSVNEDFYYEGSENMLSLLGTFALFFQCDIQLQGYPFDTQTCNIEVNNIFSTFIIYNNNK